MRWSFAKYVGCGNDFIFFDNRKEIFPHSQSSLIQHLCHRQRGIGADGILLLENSTTADFRMRIFNSDGSEAEMCGNGARCFVKGLESLGFQHPSYHIEVMNNFLEASRIGEVICVQMGSPLHLQWNIPLRFENQFLYVHYLNTGVPHAVLFMEEIDHLNLMELGTYIRHYSLWKPKGTNVTVAQQVAPQKFKIRTYERGVEGETLACGTGATAAALAAAYHYGVASPLTILTRSGEELSIGFSFQQQNFSKVTLTGSAEEVFRGEIDLLENERIFSFSIACNSANSVKS